MVRNRHSVMAKPLDYKIVVYEFKFQSHYYIPFQTNILGGESTYLPNPSTQAGYDTRSIFERSLTGLNSVFLLLD